MNFPLVPALRVVAVMVPATMLHAATPGRQAISPVPADITRFMGGNFPVTKGYTGELSLIVPPSRISRPDLVRFNAASATFFPGYLELGGKPTPAPAGGELAAPPPTPAREHNSQKAQPAKSSPPGPS